MQVLLMSSVQEREPLFFYLGYPANQAVLSLVLVSYAKVLQLTKMTPESKARHFTH